jgi:hypothetical protein
MKKYKIVNCINKDGFNLYYAIKKQYLYFFWKVEYRCIGMNAYQLITFDTIAQAKSFIDERRKRELELKSRDIKKEVITEIY